MMKKTFLCAAMVLLSVCLQAQEPFISVSTNKTIAMVFDLPILHVDKGNPGLLVQQVRQADNLLMLKAASVHLPETNLSVLTADGKLTSFLIRYQAIPDQLMYHFNTDRVRVKNKGISQDELLDYAHMISDNERKILGVRQKSGAVVLQLNGIYQTKEVVFFHLQVQNSAPGDFTIHGLRFFIRDQPSGPRTAVQEQELLPLRSWEGSAEISKGQSTCWIAALPIFSLLNHQLLAIEVEAANNARPLEVQIKNRQLMKAIGLPPHPLYERQPGTIR